MYENISDGIQLEIQFFSFHKHDWCLIQDCFLKYIHSPNAHEIFIFLPPAFLL